MRFWKRLNPDGTTKAVESYSHDLEVFGVIEITEVEFNTFLDSLPHPPPPIDWKALWKAADTPAKERAVLVKRLELE